LCVLSVLWIVNEVMNRKLMDVDKMIQRRVPFVLQYGVVQLALFVMGIMLAIGVVHETGAIAWLGRWCLENIHNVWLMGAIAAAFSTVLDTFASAMSFISLFQNFPQNDVFWKIIAFSTAMGGSTMLIGSVAGLALMKMEHIRVGWYLRNVGWVVALSWLLGMIALFLLNC